MQVCISVVTVCSLLPSLRVYLAGDDRERRLPPDQREARSASRIDTIMPLRAGGGQWYGSGQAGNDLAHDEEGSIGTEPDRLVSY
jgi:hypothetical protein